jgi:hypothetical protein
VGAGGKVGRKVALVRAFVGPNGTRDSRLVRGEEESRTSRSCDVIVKNP